MSGGDEKFGFRDIIPEKSFIGKFGQIFGLFSEEKLSYKGLIWLMVISLVALSSVTYMEGRFAYGSVTIDVPNIGTVLGMSFMGDTMVWPNIFLIPLCLVLTLKAAQRTVSLLNELCKKVEGSLSRAQKLPELEATVKEVKEIFKGNVGQTARLNIALPWFLAIVFWGYNTLTCGFGHYEFIPNPYTAKEVVVITQDDIGRDIKTKTPVAEELELPKWDTGRKDTGRRGAEKSIWLTRVWTLIFYTILPFIMLKLLWMVWGLTFFIKSFRVWAGNTEPPEHRNEKNGFLLVSPFHEDGYGGLSAIAETGMSYFYAAIGFVLLISMSFFKEGPDPSWHNYAFVALLIPVALVVFLVPIIQAREIMKNAKRTYLKYIGQKLKKMFNELDDSLNTPGARKLESGFHTNLNSMKMYYDQVLKIQEWPLTSSIVIRVSLVILAPLSGILLNIVITRSIG